MQDIQSKLNEQQAEAQRKVKQQEAYIFAQLMWRNLLDALSHMGNLHIAESAANVWIGQYRAPNKSDSQTSSPSLPRAATPALFKPKQDPAEIGLKAKKTGIETAVKINVFANIGALLIVLGNALLQAFNLYGTASNPTLTTTPSTFRK